MCHTALWQCFHLNSWLTVKKRGLRFDFYKNHDLRSVSNCNDVVMPEGQHRVTRLLIAYVILPLLSVQQLSVTMNGNASTVTHGSVTRRGTSDLSLFSRIMISIELAVMASDVAIPGGQHIKATRVLNYHYNCGFAKCVLSEGRNELQSLHLKNSWLNGQKRDLRFDYCTNLINDLAAMASDVVLHQGGSR